MVSKKEKARRRQEAAEGSSQQQEADKSDIQQLKEQNAKLSEQLSDLSKELKALRQKSSSQQPPASPQGETQAPGEKEPGESKHRPKVGDSLDKDWIVVPKKGVHTPTAQKVVGFMKELGCENVDAVVKSDQEPAIRAMVREVIRLRSASGVRTIPEASPAYSSASNGVVERGVQTVEAQMRVMRSALEARWKATVGETHAI